MRNILILGFTVLFFIGCASAPPALRMIAPNNTTANVTPEAAPAVEDPVQKLKRPKATGQGTI